MSLYMGYNEEEEVNPTELTTGRMYAIKRKNYFHQFFDEENTPHEVVFGRFVRANPRAEDINDIKSVLEPNTQITNRRVYSGAGERGGVKKCCGGVDDVFRFLNTETLLKFDEVEEMKTGHVFAANWYEMYFSGFWADANDYSFHELIPAIKNAAARDEDEDDNVY
jgi:hypothetical protein